MFEPDFSPPAGLELPLWRSLLINLADRFAPERHPPLQLTSRPVDVVLAGDLIHVPWYRTIFTSIGDVLSPEKLAPLELESRPVEVGELLADELSHGWWNSLLQSLRDRLAPEKLPPLPLTSHPVPGFGAESNLQILDWSTLIDGPKLFRADAPVAASAGPGPGSGEPASAPPDSVPLDPAVLAARMQLVRDIGRTRFRRRIWISLAAGEAVFLLVAIFRFQ
ncbi:MAG TPA: hypothetical protein VL240_00200 [Candidatus Binatia bacterium]|nr:hypothetical protein [Candidatus Binatia bacterium]